MFIKLHLRNGDEIRINKDMIESYGAITDNTYKNADEDFIGHTYIITCSMVNDDKPYAVKETPEEIDSIIRYWE